MRIFFLPAVSILNKLKYLQKFILIGSIFILPLLIIMYMLVSEINERIDFAAKEKAGVVYVAPVKRLLEDIHQYRQLSILEEYQDNNQLMNIKRKQVEIEQDIQEVRKINNQWGAILGVRGDWGILDERLQNLLGASALGVDAKHPLCDDVVRFIVKVGNLSNLILDPDLDSYYLMDAFINKIPSIAASLSDIGIAGIQVIGKGTQERGGDYLLLSSQYSIAKNTLGLLNEGFQTVFENNASLIPKLKNTLQEDTATMYQFLNLVNTKVLNNQQGEGVHLLDYNTYLNNTQERLFEFDEFTGIYLSKLLSIRINTFKLQKQFALGLVFLMFLVVTYFFIGFYISVKNAVSALGKVAEIMSREKAGEEIVLESKDELAEVASAFNTIGRKLKESYSDLEAINEELEEEVGQRINSEQALSKLNKELEQRVLERTKELDKLNQELRQDIERRKEVELSLSIQFDIIRLLASASALEELSPKILEIIGEKLGHDAGAFWMKDPFTQKMRCVNYWNSASFNGFELNTLYSNLSFVKGEGFPGKVWAEGRVVEIEDIATSSDLFRVQYATMVGLKAAIGFPIRLNGEVTGVFEFFSSQLRRPKSEILQMLDIISGQVSQFVNRLQAEEEILKLSRSVEQSPSTVMITDTQGIIEYVNPKFTQLTGYSIEEIKGKNVRLLKSGKTLPEVYQQLWGAILLGKEWRGELLNKKKTGELYWEFTIISPLTNRKGELAHFIALKEDITNQKTTRLRLSVQYAVTRLLAGASSLKEISQEILEIVGEKLGWDTGAIWLVDSLAGALVCFDFWHLPLEDVSEFKKASLEITFSKGIGLPGRVWVNNVPHWIEDVASDQNFPRASFAAKNGLHGAFGFPIRLGNEVVGVFEFFTHEFRKPDDELLRMFDSIGDQIGNLIKRTRAEDDLRALNQSLEQRILERTLQLQTSNTDLQQASEFNKLLLQTIPFSMDIVDEQGTILFISQKFEELFGTQALGKKCWQLYKDNKKQCFNCPLYKNITLGKTEILEVSGILGDRVFQISHTGMRYQNKQAILEIFEDITERKRAEEKVNLFSSIAIAVAEAQDMDTAFSIILQKVCEATGWVYGEMWVPDARGQILESSPAWYSSNEGLDKFRELSQGYTFAPGVGIPGRAWQDKKLVVSPDLTQDSNFPRLAIALEAGLRKGIAIPILAGEEVVSVMNFFTLQIGEEKIVQLFWAVAIQLGAILRRKQIEEELKKAYVELKRTQDQLVHSAKMASIGQLAAGVAHEINNPLTGVLNNVQLIRMIMAKHKPLSLDEFTDILRIIEEAAGRCKKITKSLLAFSHISTGDFQEISLNALIEEVVGLIEYEMRLQNIVIYKELQDGLPKILGDVQLLQQVIFDTLSNARWAIQEKADREDNRITLKTEYFPESKNVFLYISDTGIGIAQENINRLFEPFFTTKAVGEGTGLGLSIIYSIIKKHKGNIEVSSEINKGTCIKIILPIIEK